MSPILFGSLLLAAGVGAIVYGLYLTVRHRRLMQRGAIAQARVVSRQSDAVSDDSRCHLTVCFTPDGEDSVTREVRCSTGLFEECPEGAPVTVKYAEGKPTDFILADERNAQAANWAIVGLGVFMIVLGSMALAGMLGQGH